AAQHAQHVPSHATHGAGCEQPTRHGRPPRRRAPDQRGTQQKAPWRRARFARKATQSAPIRGGIRTLSRLFIGPPALLCRVMVSSVDLSPFMKCLQHWAKRLAFLRQEIFKARRMLFIEPRPNHALVFKALKPR